MKKIVFLILIFSGLSLSAQTEKKSDSLDTNRFTENQFSINFLPPSLEYEIAIGDRSTIDLIGGVGFLYHRSFDENVFQIFPLFQGQYRQYYNFEKRLEKGKKIKNNSANYLAGTLILELDQNELSGIIGPAWGLQRVYGQHFKLNLSLGAGYGFNSVDSYLGTIISFQLGFKLGK